MLFEADDGIYFYNEETNKQKRIGSNCFKEKPERLTDNVFYDEDNMYFLRFFKSLGALKIIQSVVCKEYVSSLF